jgi:cysteinyl-tRNA synthetase
VCSSDLGLDLRFPHHENELAQSTAAGHAFARHWVHNGLVNTGGKKMSKSLGNSLFAHELLRAARPIVLRYFLGSAHYRSVLEFSPDSLAEAGAAFERIEGFITRIEAAFGADDAGGAGTRVGRIRPLGGAATVAMLPDDFIAAVLDDFGAPQALAALHGAVRAGNTAIDAGDRDVALTRASEVVAMLDVLGLDPRDEHWAASHTGAGGAEAAALDTLITALIEERREARARKDFATSDAIRDRLQQAGVALEDSPNGTRWSLA